MVGSKVLGIRIMGLGDDGCRALPAVIRAVSDLWSGDGGVVIESARVGDDAQLATRTIRRWCDRERVDVVLTVGRGGHGREDFAPEITTALVDRSLPGIEERMYLGSPRSPHDLLFRGRAGMRRRTLVVNLPARPARARAIVRFLGPVIVHAVEKAHGSDRECAGAGASP
jgi:molybdopterin biosynthesis enzyme MoaB